MSCFTLSAFADEYSPDLQEQIYGLIACGISQIEPRGINGINISGIRYETAEKFGEELSETGIGISAIGSPAGKVSVENANEHFKLFERTVKIAKILGANRIRGFSFFTTDKENDRDRVLFALDRMLNLADKNGILYCHENEKGIYGDDLNSCLDIMECFSGTMGCVFDPANFIQCGVEPYEAFDALYPYITYMHIKDALPDGTIVAAGEGVGKIPLMLHKIAQEGRGCTLTLEPHLKVFDGLEALEGGKRTKIQTTFPSSAEAFTYAADKLKEIIKSL